MKINKELLKQLTGSLAKEKIENKPKIFGCLFDIINKLKPEDNKIDIEEITKFANSIFEFDNVALGGNGDGKLSNREIDNYIENHKEIFNDIKIKSRDIKNFLKFFIKNADKANDNDIRINNDDGSYSIITTREEFKSEQVCTNQQEIAKWEKEQQGQDTPNAQSIFNEPQQSGPSKKPEPIYKTVSRSIGMVNRKINYNSYNQIVSIEETRNNITTITDANGIVSSIIIKNDGAKDTIKEYNILEDGTKEEKIFYGENGIKDSNTPKYKNVYQNDKLISKYFYNENGEIIKVQNYDRDGVVSVVTSYDNGIEAKVTNIHTNDIYNYADAVADGIIDPSLQHSAGDCYLLNTLQELQQEPAGSQALAKCIQRDIPNKGDYTITFKKAYGPQKEFIITKEELEKAEDATNIFYTLPVQEGDEIYVDGKFEITITSQETFKFNKEDIKNNIIFIRNGQEEIWTIDDLATQTIPSIRQKYSSGDIDTLAFEIAYERNRAQAGIPLGGGTRNEVLSCVLGDGFKIHSYINCDLSIAIHSQSVDNQTTISEEEMDKKWYDAQYALTSSISYRSEYLDDTASMISTLQYYKNHLSNCILDLSICMDGGYHAGHIKRFEDKNGKTYVVYTHPWDPKAEITEEIRDFAKKIRSINVISLNNQEDVTTNTDGKISNYNSSSKRNLSNITSAINAYINIYGKATLCNMLTKDSSGNVTIQLPNQEPICISAKEISTAITNGNYADDGDVAALEIAIERLINNKLHHNTLYKLEHTDMEKFDIKDVLQLLCGKPLSTYNYSGSSYINDIQPNKQLIIAHSDFGQNVFVKRIENNPDGTKNVVVISSEDSGVEITYTQAEFCNRFRSTLYTPVNEHGLYKK